MNQSQLNQLSTAIKDRQLKHTSVWIETRDAVQDTLNIILESLADLEEDTTDKTAIHVTKAEQETLHLAMDVLHQQGFVNTQGYTKMLEVLKVN